MLNRTSPFFSLFRASLRTLCALVLCGCCVSFLFCGCSNNDDYEIYATIHGRVTDFESGAPIANAIVTLSPSSLTQQTNGEGGFTFSNLDAGTYTLTVQKAGYQPNRKTVTAISGESMEVNIPLTIIER